MKTLIISLGMNEEPVIFSIRYHSPEFVIFFCSESTVENLKSIRRKTDIKESHYSKCIIKNPEDINKCVKAAKECLGLIPKHKHESQVIVDITGGTKAMTAGLLFGTSGNGFDYSYVGGARDNKKQGGVVSGKEKITQVRDPADVFKDSDKAMITGLFNIYRYDAVAGIISEMIIKSDEEDLYNGLKMVSEGYAQWDRFMHRDAHNLISQGKKRIETYNRYADNSQISSFLKSIDSNLGSLSRLKESGRENKVSPEIINDLYSNAIRRMEEGKYDDATARAYGCMELAGKYSLYQHGINDSDVKEEILPENIRKEFIKKYKSENGRIQLPLYAKFRLLSALKDNAGKRFEENYGRKYQSLLSARNESILAHGTVPIKKETCREFITMAKEIIPDSKKEITFPKIGFFEK